MAVPTSRPELTPMVTQAQPTNPYSGNFDQNLRESLGARGTGFGGVYRDPSGAGVAVVVKGNTPSELLFFDANGVAKRGTAFTAKNLYSNAQRYGLDLSGISSLTQQLEANNIKHKPYELYAGTGSDHGIDFNDIAAGGMGTAYDWTKDVNAAYKDAQLVGTAAQGQASKNIADTTNLVKNLGITKNANVTTDLGFDDPRATFTSLINGAGDTSGYAVRNGNGSVSWYNTMQEAQNYANHTGGQVADLTGRAPLAGSMSHLGDRGIDISGIATQPFQTGSTYGGNPFIQGGQTTQVTSPRVPVTPTQPYDPYKPWGGLTNVNGVNLNPTPKLLSTGLKTPGFASSAPVSSTSRDAKLLSTGLKTPGFASSAPVSSTSRDANLLSLGTQRMLGS